MAKNNTADRMPDRKTDTTVVAASQKTREDAARKDAARFTEALSRADRATDRDIDHVLRGTAR